MIFLSKKLAIVLGFVQKILLLHRISRTLINGEMAERFNAPVLKTDEGNTSGGSNPSLSASFFKITLNIRGIAQSG